MGILSEKRKRSSLIMSGAFVSFMTIGAVQQCAGADHSLNVLGSARSDIRSSLGNSSKVLFWTFLKTVAYLFLLGMSALFLYRLFRYFRNHRGEVQQLSNYKNEDNQVDIHEEVQQLSNHKDEENQVGNHEEEQQLGNHKDEEDKVNNHKNESHPLSFLTFNKYGVTCFSGCALNVKYFFELFYNDELYDISNVKIKATVKELKGILSEDSAKKIEAQAEIRGLDDESEIEITISNAEYGYLELTFGEETALVTKYVDYRKVENFINFFNAVFEKDSSDNGVKRKIRLQQKDDEIYIGLYKINKSGEAILIKDAPIAFDAKLSLQREKDVKNIFMEYLWGKEKYNILDRLFFVSNSGDVDYGNIRFDFSKDISFALGLDLKISGDTVFRILDDDSYVNLSGEAEDYLEKNRKKDVKIRILEIKEPHSFQFCLLDDDGKEFRFKDILRTRCADNDVDKLIEFYNYILKESSKQKKLGIDLEEIPSLHRDKEKIDVSVGNFYQEYKGGNLVEILKDIKSDMDYCSSALDGLFKS